MTRIEITSTEWTIECFREDWAEGDDTAAVARECADAQYAWLINNTSARLSGWTYASGTFSGEIKADAPMQIMTLIGDSTDYVLSVLDEIKADAAAEAQGNSLPAAKALGFDPAQDGCVFHRDAFGDVKRNLCGKAAAWYSVEGDLWCDSAMALFKREMGATDPAVLAAVKVA